MTANRQNPKCGQWKRPKCMTAILKNLNAVNESTKNACLHFLKFQMWSNTPNCRSQFSKLPNPCFYHGQILQYGFMRVKIKLLKHHCHMISGHLDPVFLSHQFSCDIDLSAGWFLQMVDTPDQGTLTASAGTQNNQLLAFSDREIDIIQYLQIPISFRKCSILIIFSPFSIPDHSSSVYWLTYNKRSQRISSSAPLLSA